VRADLHAGPREPPHLLRGHHDARRSADAKRAAHVLHRGLAHGWGEILEMVDDARQRRAPLRRGREAEAPEPDRAEIDAVARARAQALDDHVVPHDAEAHITARDEERRRQPEALQDRQADFDVVRVAVVERDAERTRRQSVGREPRGGVVQGQHVEAARVRAHVPLEGSRVNVVDDRVRLGQHPVISDDNKAPAPAARGRQPPRKACGNAPAHAAAFSRTVVHVV
jgi:hypothetical protein